MIGSVIAVASPARGCITLIDAAGHSLDVPDAEVLALAEALIAAFGTRALATDLSGGAQ